MRHVNRWTPPRFIRLWMVAATRGGDGWLWYITAGLVLFTGGPERFRALLAGVLAVALGVGLFINVKRACGRKRPCALEPHCWTTLLPPDQFSFPSGHTITAFSVAICFGTFYPPMLPGLLFCACSVAVSRVILGMHFLSDVVVGAAIGGTLGYTAAMLLR